MFERIDIVEQMCEYGLQLLEHLFEGVVMRSKSIVQVQAKTVSERYRNSFLRAHHRVLAVVVTISACFALCCVTAGARESDAVVEAASSEVVHYTVQPEIRCGASLRDSPVIRPVPTSGWNGSNR